MSFDPMAAVVDWLDAYRSSDLEAIVELYADEATITCNCDGGATIHGRQAVRAYWQHRVVAYPASDLENLQPARDGAAVVYLSHGSPIRSDFEFNAAGQIIFQRCGRSN